MLLDVLGRAPGVEAFGEEDLRVMTEECRLRSLDTVRRVALLTPAPTLMLKPICESHYADHILRQIDGAHAVWIYRDYRDVVNSATRLWPGHALDIAKWMHAWDRSLLGWRGERLPRAWREEFTQFPLESLNETEAFALFWHLRNRVYFDCGLVDTNLVLLVRYEDLVQAPDTAFPRVFDFFGLRYRNEFAAHVSARSLGKHAAPDIRPEIAALCDSMQARFDEALATQTERAAAPRGA